MGVAACADATAVDADCGDPPAVDADEAVELYLAAWTEDDASERACALSRSLAADAALIDSTTAVLGHTAVEQVLDRRIAGLLAQPTTREAAAAVEFRHHEARLSWISTDASGTVVERGEDWLELDDAGRLSRIHIFAGVGAEAPLGEPLLAWQRAWNARDDVARADELILAVTDDVRFTDAVADIRGREALGAEIARQVQALDVELRLDDPIEVFASVDGAPVLVRVSGRIVVPPGELEVVDYVRVRDGRIERLSGFPRR